MCGIFSQYANKIEIQQMNVIILSIFLFFFPVFPTEGAHEGLYAEEDVHADYKLGMAAIVKANPGCCTQFCCIFCIVCCGFEKFMNADLIEEARLYFERQERNRHHPQSMYNLALINANRRDFDKALGFLEEARLQVEDRTTDIYSCIIGLLINCYFENKQYDRAVNLITVHADQVCQENNKNPYLTYYIALFYVHGFGVQKDYPRAKMLFNLSVRERETPFCTSAIFSLICLGLIEEYNLTGDGGDNYKANRLYNRSLVVYAGSETSANEMLSGGENGRLPYFIGDHIDRTAARESCCSLRCCSMIFPTSWIIGGIFYLFNRNNPPEINTDDWCYSFGCARTNKWPALNIGDFKLYASSFI